MSSSLQSLRDLKKKKQKLQKNNILLMKDYNLPLSINYKYKNKNNFYNSNTLFRCVLTGRSRSVLTKYKLTRMAFKCLSSSGLIPGVTKSSF